MQTNPIPRNLLIIRRPDFRRAAGNMSRSQDWELARLGKVPPVVKLGPSSTGAHLGEVERYLADPLNYRAPHTADKGDDISDTEAGDLALAAQ